LDEYQIFLKGNVVDTIKAELAQKKKSLEENLDKNPDLQNIEKSNITTSIETIGTFMETKFYNKIYLLNGINLY